MPCTAKQLSPTSTTELIKNYRKIQRPFLTFLIIRPTHRQQQTHKNRPERGMGNQAFRGTNYLFLTAEKGELKGEMELTRHGNFHIGS